MLGVAAALAETLMNGKDQRLCHKLRVLLYMGL